MPRILTALPLALALLVSGCNGQSNTPSGVSQSKMPDVVGKGLDVALGDIAGAGYSGKPDVLGGGALGVVVKANWTVCQQDPAPGALIKDKPRLTVARECVASSESSQPTPTVASARDCPSFNHCATFGDTVTDTVRFSTGKTIPVEITVSAPRRFTPSDPADAKQAVNVYFTVTIKNTSASEPFVAAFVIGETSCTVGGQLVPGDLILDIDKHIRGVDGAPTIKPGRSLTFKHGFSVASVDTLTYSISPAGRAADTFDFLR